MLNFYKNGFMCLGLGSYVFNGYDNEMFGCIYGHFKYLHFIE
jgi:hypothetical protein